MIVVAETGPINYLIALAQIVALPKLYVRTEPLTYDNVMDSVVMRDPEIMSGEATFRGTRVLVRTLFDYIEAGYSLDRFLEGFPTVSRETALLAIEEAKESLLASH
jgi:uncharacterized protein (DUF433 family)